MRRQIRKPGQLINVLCLHAVAAGKLFNFRHSTTVHSVWRTRALLLSCLGWFLTIIWNWLMWSKFACSFCKLFRKVCYRSYHPMRTLDTKSTSLFVFRSAVNDTLPSDKKKKYVGGSRILTIGWTFLSENPQKDGRDTGSLSVTSGRLKIRQQRQNDRLHTSLNTRHSSSQSV